MSKINFTYTNLAPFKWYVLENFPFIEADFDALTNWQLFCKLGKEMNKIIKSVNVSGEQVETLTNAFNNLQNYVNNYFDNLDVQEEINNKLDQMAQSGELAELLTAYLNLKCIYGFNTVDDMSKATNLVDGSFCKTYGRNTLNDGYGQFYKVRQITSSDVVDGYNIVALDVSPTLIAEKMKNQEIIDLTNNINTINTNLTEKINNLNTNLTGQINSVDNKYTTYFNLFSRDNVDFYVDGINGNDENNGSQSTPFKTFDRFLQEYYRYAELRCHFIGSASEYDMNSIETFNSCGMHLLNESDNTNITINFNGVYTPSFYNSHLNISGSSNKYITLNIPNDLYFDSASFGGKYVHFTNGKLGVYVGSAISLEYPDFDNSEVAIGSAICYLRGANFSGKGTHCVDVHNGGILNIRTSFTNNMKTSQSIVYAISSTIFFNCSLKNNISDLQGLNTGNTQIVATDGKFNSWNINNSVHNDSSLLGNSYQFLS